MTARVAGENSVRSSLAHWEQVEVSSQFQGIELLPLARAYPLRGTGTVLSDTWIPLRALLSDTWSKTAYMSSFSIHMIWIWWVHNDPLLTLIDSFRKPIAAIGTTRCLASAPLS